MKKVRRFRARRCSRLIFLEGFQKKWETNSDWVAPDCEVGFLLLVMRLVATEPDKAGTPCDEGVLNVRSSAFRRRPVSWMAPFREIISSPALSPRLLQVPRRGIRCQ